MFFGLPNEANHLDPFLKIVGTTAIVSTLLIIVGQPYKPIKAGKGGFNLGWPFLPCPCSSFDQTIHENFHWRSVRFVSENNWYDVVNNT